MTGPGDGPEPDREPQQRDVRDDAALVEAHLAGDPDAFAELFARHRDRLWAVALRTTGDREDAADALQDALISAYRRADSFRGESAVTTWLHRIVVNACLDRLRRRKVRAAEPLPEDLEGHASRGSLLGTRDPHASESDPEARALAGERRDRVLAALDTLPADQKAALVLVDLEGYPVQEAAEILEVPVGTVKSRCSRGRARLAVLLSDLAPPPGTAPGSDASHLEDPGRAPAEPPGHPPDRSDETHQEVSGHE